MASLRHSALLALATSSTLAIPTSSDGSHGSSAPSVRVKNGTLIGIHSTSYNQDFFLGIPFAQPPIGNLRFQVPQPINSSWSSSRDATKYSAACVGYGSDDWPYASLSEDCLYLNVVRPSGYEDEKLPVGFWIHGGGLYEGSSVDQRYNLSFIVERSVKIGKPIIGVSVNYRLSMWGFVTGEEVVKSGVANLGFRDQRLALHWVQESIGVFGGDASKVTIWGESAGGLSVGMHLTAYNGRDDKLFRGAIMESGNPINYGTFTYNTSDLINAASAVGCDTSASVLPCLRGLSFEKLNGFINSTAGQALHWKPIIDGDYIQNPTSKQLSSGRFVHVPILDGANSDEGTAFGPRGINTTEQFISYLHRSATPTLSMPQATGIMADYPENITYGAVPTGLPTSWIPPAYPYGKQFRRAAAYAGDVTMIAPRRKTCETWAANKIPAYCYRFNAIPNGIPPEIGATHFQEVAFVFNNKDGVGYGYPGVSEKPFQGKQQSYYDLSDAMSAAWVSFVADQDPGDWWPEYADGAKNWVFDAEVNGLGFAEKDDWRKAGIDLINYWNLEVYNR